MQMFSRLAGTFEITAVAHARIPYDLSLFFPKKGHAHIPASKFLTGPLKTFSGEWDGGKKYAKQTSV
jgi:hypothetical protein